MARKQALPATHNPGGVNEMKTILGTRIRERRAQLCLTQAELARRIGISASYLNLIERNKRPISDRILRQTAEALDLKVEALDGTSERHLIEALIEIAHMPEIAPLGIEADQAGDFIGRYPGWARALAALARSERSAVSTARALADRLAHDPFLAETVHRMLTRISAVRSASEILTDYADLTAVEHSRFLDIAHTESQALSDVGAALAGYFDRIDAADATLTPTDEVEALFDARDNRFAEIEDAIAGPDADRATTDVIDGLLDRAPEIATAPAKDRARAALSVYAARARALPMQNFAPAAASLRYDVDALADRFDTDVDAIIDRLTALPRGPSVPRCGCLSANAAGALLTIRGLPGLAVPRYATACPLWVLFRAQATPATTIRQLVSFPSGQRFVFIARARNTGGTGFGAPRHYVTDMLAMTEADAAHTVYSVAPGTEAEDVGPACRICNRRTCPHRVDDPLGG